MKVCTDEKRRNPSHFPSDWIKFDITGRNDIAEILLKVELNTKNQIIKSICLFYSTLILNAIQKFVTLKCIFLTYFSL
jgi:hypothetical protein